MFKIFIMKNIYQKLLAKFILGIFAFSFLVNANLLADDFSFVKAYHLNVRALPSVKWKIIAVVDNWYRVTILENANKRWKKVLLENGQIGYVNGTYLTNIEPYYKKVDATQYTIKKWDAFMRWFNLVDKVAVLHEWDLLEVTSIKIYDRRWIQLRVVTSNTPRYIGRTWYVAKWLLKWLNSSWFNQEEPSAEVPLLSAPSIDPNLNTSSKTNIDNEFYKMFSDEQSDNVSSSINISETNDNTDSTESIDTSNEVQSTNTYNIEDDDDISLEDILNSINLDE